MNRLWPRFAALVSSAALLVFASCLCFPASSQSSAPNAWLRLLQAEKQKTENRKHTDAAPAVRAETPVSFNNEVVPILTRRGCNMGTCHGAQYGKGGFKLSLAGFDSDLDYAHIVRQARGRRITLAEPASSLFLQKPIYALAHGGGKRLEPAGADYQTLLRWLRQGAPGPNPADPFVTKIEVSPAERILAPHGTPSQLTVRASYSDGTQRDVTAHTRISTLNEAIAACSPDGLVTPNGKGQTAIMARYGGQATVCTIIVPFRQNPAHFQTKASAGLSVQPNFIDALVERKQQQLGLSPSPLCDDRTFLRRSSLDIIGTLPTSGEISAFLSGKAPNKREKWIDTLLARPEYADYWTLKWGDLLRSNRTQLSPKGMWSFTSWIHDQFRDNRSMNAFARDLILPQGSVFTNGPSNYYRVADNPQALAETTSQVFLGIRLQCARCHQHPFEKWSQTDYYQFAAYFARVGIKDSADFGLFGQEKIVYIKSEGEAYHPKTNKPMRPAPLGVKLAALNGKPGDADADGDRRIALADWLTGTNNRLFARNIANRYWGYLFGRGIVNPIDDMRVTNPPANPQLLDALADELIRTNYDVKHLIKCIALSRAYQRSADATPDNRKDEWFCTHYLPKRLPAETLLDAIDFVCGTHEKYDDLPPGTRAIQLPDANTRSEFLDIFGRPLRLTDCECERQSEPNLSQTLRLMNGEATNRKAGQEGGRLAGLLAAKRTDAAILNEIYTAALGRSPRPKERNIVLCVLAFSPDRKAVFEDVLLTLLNSKEFLFNH